MKRAAMIAILLCSSGPGSIATVVFGIDGNVLMGSYDDSGGHTHGFEAILAPEPPSLRVVVAAGILGLLYWRQRVRVHVAA